MMEDKLYVFLPVFLYLQSGPITGITIKTKSELITGITIKTKSKLITGVTIKSKGALIIGLTTGGPSVISQVSLCVI